MRYTPEFKQYVNSLSLDAEYQRIFGEEPVGKIFCPFHPNTNTPAAKVYDNHIKCFVCQRSYGVFDLLRVHDPDRLREIARSAPMSGARALRHNIPQTLIPPRESLDFSRGVTVQLLDYIINYGNQN